MKTKIEQSAGIEKFAHLLQPVQKGYATAQEVAAQLVETRKFLLGDSQPTKNKE